MMVFFALLFLAQVGQAQKQDLFYFKDAFSTAVADTIFYPVRGSFQIDESAFGSYKNLQLWVYDSREKEIYYVVQSISTNEEMAYLVEKMIDKTYTMFMMKQGHILAEKCEETEIIERW